MHAPSANQGISRGPIDRYCTLLTTMRDLLPCMYGRLWNFNICCFFLQRTWSWKRNAVRQAGRKLRLRPSLSWWLAQSRDGKWLGWSLAYRSNHQGRQNCACRDNLRVDQEGDAGLGVGRAQIFGWWLPSQWRQLQWVERGHGRKRQCRWCPALYRRREHSDCKDPGEVSLFWPHRWQHGDAQEAPRPVQDRAASNHREIQRSRHRQGDQRLAGGGSSLHWRQASSHWLHLKNEKSRKINPKGGTKPKNH